MSRKISYLQGRGDAFSFRIAIPDELQKVIGKREFTKTLETGDKSVAIPKALMLASGVKRVLNQLKKVCPKIKAKPNEARVKRWLYL